MHRFHRPAALVASRFGGGEVAPLLEFLQPTPIAGDFSDADLRTFSALGLKRPQG